MIGGLFFSRTTCFLFKQQQYIMLVTPSLWWYMWGAVLAVEREVGRGLLCANNKPSTPRYSPLGKPAHPTDRPTGTIKQLCFFVAFFFFACALRLSSRSNQQNNNKNEPLLLYCSMPLLVYIITTLLTMYYSVFCFVMFGGSAGRLI